MNNLKIVGMALPWGIGVLWALIVPQMYYPGGWLGGLLTALLISGVVFLIPENVFENRKQDGD